ncbi:FUSC family membrane protein [Shigella flexneri]
MRNLVITLVSFLIAASPLSRSFPGPGCLPGLTVSTSGFICSAASATLRHYRVRALLIPIYTMLGSSPWTRWYQQPVLLLLGAIWYNLF